MRYRTRPLLSRRELSGWNRCPRAGGASTLLHGHWALPLRESWADAWEGRQKEGQKVKRCLNLILVLSSFDWRFVKNEYENKCFDETIFDVRFNFYVVIGGSRFCCLFAMDQKTISCSSLLIDYYHHRSCKWFLNSLFELNSSLRRSRERIESPSYHESNIVLWFLQFQIETPYRSTKRKVGFTFDHFAKRCAIKRGSQLNNWSFIRNAQSVSLIWKNISVCNVALKFFKINIIKNTRSYHIQLVGRNYCTKRTSCSCRFKNMGRNLVDDCWIMNTFSLLEQMKIDHCHPTTSFGSSLIVRSFEEELVVEFCESDLNVFENFVFVRALPNHCQSNYT